MQIPLLLCYLIGLVPQIVGYPVSPNREVAFSPSKGFPSASNETQSQESQVDRINSAPLSPERMTGEHFTDFNEALEGIPLSRKEKPTYRHVDLNSMNGRSPDRFSTPSRPRNYSKRRARRSKSVSGNQQVLLPIEGIRMGECVGLGCVKSANTTSLVGTCISAVCKSVSKLVKSTMPGDSKRRVSAGKQPRMGEYKGAN